MIVTFIIVALNAAEHLGSLLSDLKNQDYDHKKVEVILVDSISLDNTKQIMEEFASSNDFLRTVVLDNPKRTLPCGWNIALHNSSGDIVLRVDAHALIPPDFISRNVDCISRGRDICGGQVESILEPTGGMLQEVLLAAENSAFGGGIAPFRRINEGKNVKTLAFAAYRKEIFEDVGYYDERLARTEDNEMHYRMRRAGNRFFMDPTIKSKRYTRNTLREFIRQKYKNGYWIGLTLSVAPRCFSIYHLIPFVWVLALLCSTLLVGLKITSMPAFLMWTSYLAVSLILTTLSLRRYQLGVKGLLLPMIFLLTHLSYGIGTLCGLIVSPIWKRKETGLS